MKSEIKNSKVAGKTVVDNENVYNHMLCRVKAWVVETSKDLWRVSDREDLSVISWNTDTSGSTATKTWAKLSKLVLGSNSRRYILMNAQDLVTSLEAQFEAGTVLK